MLYFGSKTISHDNEARGVKRGSSWLTTHRVVVAFHA
jgi:hypothetical protein